MPCLPIAAIINLGDRVLLSLATFDNRINAEEESTQSLFLHFHSLKILLRG